MLPLLPSALLCCSLSTDCHTDLVYRSNCPRGQPFNQGRACTFQTRCCWFRHAQGNMAALGRSPFGEIALRNMVCCSSCLHGWHG